MKAAADWNFPSPYGGRHVAILLLGLALLWFTGARLDMGRMALLTGEAILAPLGLVERSQVADGLGRVVGQLVPIHISDREDIGRIAGFDPDHLPLFAHLETVEKRVERLDPATLRMTGHIERATMLVRPFGYLGHVAVKMLETLEIALWGTLLSVLMGLPLGLLGARNIAPHPLVRTAARGVVSVLRTIPELISALFLVVAYGFGPIAGVLALGLHGAGFLGKFYAEDMESADPKPQEALEAIGAGRLLIWRFAVLPQVMPQFIAYTLYILDRSVRMATVIGLVGAGGIGQELKGRYDMYEYGHVGTILIAILVVVLLLDHSAARMRRTWL
jgi:phosphonate transport system permease protein